MDKELVQKVHAGVPIEDDELEQLIVFYSRVKNDLDLLGPHFYLAWVEVMRTLHMLEGFKRAREERPR